MFQASVRAEADLRREHQASSLSYQLSQQLHVQAAAIAQVIASMSTSLRHGFFMLPATGALGAALRAEVSPSVRFDAFGTEEEAPLCEWLRLENPVELPPVDGAACMEAAFMLCKYSCAMLKLFSIRVDDVSFNELGMAIGNCNTRVEAIERMRWFRPKQFSHKVRLHMYKIRDL